MSCHFLLLATVETCTTNTLLWKKANSYMSENISQINFNSNTIIFYIYLKYDLILNKNMTFIKRNLALFCYIVTRILSENEDDDSNKKIF